MTEPGELYAGRALGRYELLVPLAQGATAQVWVARTTGSRVEKIVAVKAMLSELGGDVEAESMFLDEARLVSRIRHPNVAAVLDLGEEDEILYIVIEWVEGEPLQVVLREARAQGVPLPLALRIVQQAASGLHAAHEVCDEAGKPVGLVHRDVSPQNILIGYDGAVKVIDFGVAKAASNMQRTSVGQIKGKVPYMAPEQAVGDPVDRRTDVFALGVVLYQLVTGKHPFRGDSEFATLARIRDPLPAESPRKYVPDLPAALDEAMRKALAKQPNERFADMLELGRALELAVPSAPDVDRTLGTFLGTLLSQRAAKRDQAIREALRAMNERAAHVDPHPSGPPSVELGNKPEVLHEGGSAPKSSSGGSAKLGSGIRRLRELIESERPEGTAPPVPEAPALTTPVPVPSTPAPPAQAIPSIPTPPDVSSADAEAIAALRPPRSRATLIAAGVAIVVAIALVLWAVAADSPDTGEPPPTKHAF